VRVRYAPQYRRDPQRSCQRAGYRSPQGTQIPLGQVADIRQVSGPAMINSENGLLEFPCFSCTRGAIRRVMPMRKSHPRQSQNASRLLLTAGAGSLKMKSASKKRLQIVMPVCHRRHLHPFVFDISVFYRSGTRVARRAVRAYGGLYLLWLLGYNFSVAVWSASLRSWHRRANDVVW